MSIPNSLTRRLLRYYGEKYNPVPFISQRKIRIATIHNTRFIVKTEHSYDYGYEVMYDKDIRILKKYVAKRGRPHGKH